MEIRKSISDLRYFTVQSYKNEAIPPHGILMVHGLLKAKKEQERN